MLSEKPWRPEQALSALTVVFMSYVLGMVMVSLLNWTGWLGANGLVMVTVIASTLSFHGVVLVVTQVLLWEQSLEWKEAFGFLNPPLGRTLLLALLVGLIALPLTWSLQHVSIKAMLFFKIKPVVQSPVQMLQTSGSVPMKVLIGSVAILFAPFAEEVIFRGIIYPAWKQKGFARSALWGSALLFAAIHMNLMTLLPLTFLAALLTLLYERTNNLLAPVVAHSVFNLANFILALLNPTAPLLPSTP